MEQKQFFGTPDTRTTKKNVGLPHKKVGLFMGQINAFLEHPINGGFNLVSQENLQ